MLKKTTLFLLLAAVVLSISTTSCIKNTTSDNTDSLEVNKKAFSFLALGDWGRNGYFHQKDVAVQMNIAADKLWPKFIASTGDNIYQKGVASVDDPLWMTSFENIYTGPELMIDWYAVLGNHDYYGNTQAQIDYTYKSRKWNMPNRYYTFTRKLGAGDKTVTFIFLDTNQFEDYYYSRPDRYPDLMKQNPEDQINWLESVLKNSTSDWVITIGHHHVYTGGSRKEKKSSVRGWLEPLFDKYKVDAYICGHEHDLQHIKPDHGTTHYFVSGAGSSLYETGTMEYTKFAESVQGFTTFTLTGNEMIVHMINYKGEVIYKTIVSK